MVKKEMDVVEVGWDEAISRVASEFKSFRKGEIAVIGSAYATNEDNYLLQKFAREVLGTKLIGQLPHLHEGDEDALLIRADKTPNSRGAAEVGVPGGAAISEIVRAVREGNVKALYVMEDNVAADPALTQAIGRLEYLVVHATNENETTRMADVVLPASTFAEKNGTFTNFQGRVQRIRPSVATLDRDRSLDLYPMSRLDRFGTPFDRWARGPKRDARPSWKIIAGIASLMGFKYRYNSAEEVFTEIASAIELFRGMSYRKLGSAGRLLRAPKEKVGTL
jgi:NADH-quinone oxidoreductase subunit G